MMKTETRGRPKTLKREQILKVALLNYWEHGPAAVSIADICKLTGASKPGIYREFGNDDGLKCAALEAYHDLALAPMFEILERDQSFEDAKSALIAFSTEGRDLLDIPNGCLLVGMRAQQNRLGLQTAEKVLELRAKILDSYAAWIERAKANSQCDKNICTEMTALYFDAQNAGAMRMQREGVAARIISKVLSQAFSAIK